MKASSLATPLLMDHEPGVFAFFSWQGTTIIVWKQQATGNATDRLRVVSDTVSQMYPEGFSNIHIVAAGAPLPTEEARDGLAELMARYASRLACVATVFEGDGFWASAMRSLNTGLRIQAPQAYPMRVLDSLEQVADWVPGEHLRHTGHTLVARHLHAALITARVLNAVVEARTTQQEHEP